MPNTAGICNSFKSEILSGIHALGTTVVRGSTAADTIRAALYSTSANISATTTAYTASGEVTGTGYTAGGATVTNATAPTNLSGVGYWTPSASIAWATVTIGPMDCVLLYNSTQANRAIAAYTFTSTSVVAGSFTLTMPANTATTALLRIA